MTAVQPMNLEDRIKSYLEGHNVMSLSTVCNGQPHAAAVFYTNKSFDIYFVSSPSSHHGENIARNARVSATINEDYESWRDIKGLQLQGKVRQLGPVADYEEIAAAFIAKFPDVSGFFKEPREQPGHVKNKVAKVQFYVFQPLSIFYIDNSLGFGHRELLVLDENEYIEVHK